MIFSNFNSLGDLVECTPAFLEYKKRNPSENITLITSRNREYTRILDSSPSIDRIIYTDDKSKIPPVGYMDIHKVFSHSISKNIHISQGHAEVFFNMSIVKRPPIISIHDIEIEEAKHILKEDLGITSKFITIAPYSGSCFSLGGGHPNKTWDFGKWNTLLSKINIPIVLLRRKNELPGNWITNPLMKELIEYPIRLVASVIRLSHLYIAIDNGVTHVADGVRDLSQPMVQILSGTPIPWVSITSNDTRKVIYDSQIQNISEDRVWSEVRRFL